MASYEYECLLVEKLPNFVYHVKLNRTRQMNALNMKIWGEIGDVFSKIANDEDCRVVVLSGNGKAFTVGIDLKQNEIISDLNEQSESEDFARKAFKLGRKIRHMQQCFTAIEQCPKPVICAMHGYSLGGGIDLCTACDIRFCTKDTIFSIKEVDVGIIADIGTLNRIGKVCGNESWIREVAYSARNFGADEALSNQLVSRIFSNKDEMFTESLKFAESIAVKSPIAVQGTKINLNYSRDHSVQDSLNFVATWNQSQLFTEDIPKSAMATMSKTPFPPFSKL